MVHTAVNRWRPCAISASSGVANSSPSTRCTGTDSSLPMADCVATVADSDVAKIASRDPTRRFGFTWPPRGAPCAAGGCANYAGARRAGQVAGKPSSSVHECVTGQALVSDTRVEARLRGGGEQTVRHARRRLEHLEFARGDVDEVRMR